MLTRREWGGIVRMQAPFLLLCVPPLAVVSILYALNVSLSDAIRVTLWLGTGVTRLLGLRRWATGGFRWLAHGGRRGGRVAHRGCHPADSGVPAAR